METYWYLIVRMENSSPLYSWHFCWSSSVTSVATTCFICTYCGWAYSTNMAYNITHAKDKGSKIHIYYSCTCLLGVNTYSNIVCIFMCYSFFPNLPKHKIYLAWTKADQFWLPKVVWPDRFRLTDSRTCVLVAKIGAGGPGPIFPWQDKSIQ